MNFRNYQRSLFCPEQGINFLIGANAQGKTNLLEAVLMVMWGRPWRGVQESYLVNRSAAGGGVKAEIHRDGGDDVVEVRLTREQRKLRVNGQEAGCGQLPGPAALSVFTPADLLLVQGSPQERRRFVDSEVAALNHSYAGLWRRYQRALWQKSKALSAQRGRGPEVGVWDEQLAFYGARIQVLRNRWLKPFGGAARDLYREISGGGELTLDLTRSFAGADGEDECEVEKGFAAALAEESAQMTGGVTVGPHRDDLQLAVGGMNSRYTSSQGEQRTVVLALRLAGHRLRRQELAEDPVLLLDDAFYELDRGRQERLLGVLSGGGQVLATAGSAPGEGRVFRIEGGSISG